MPRKKPVVFQPVPRKLPTDLKPARDFSYSLTTPCVSYKCDGFMFLVVTKYEDHGQAFDELECSVCKKIKKLGTHQPFRNHVYLDKKKKRK